MSLRALFAWSGLIMLVAGGCWLYLSKDMKSSQVRRLWRLMTLVFIVGGGGRIAYGNWSKLDKPLEFANVLDEVLAVATILGGAAVSVYAVWVYWQNRRWGS